MKKELENEIIKYYNIHKLSSDLNILKIANMPHHDTEEDHYFRCVCNYLEPLEGWGRKVTSSAQYSSDQCYYCQEKLSELYPEYQKNKIAKNCGYCYWFCSKQYVLRGGGLKFTKKQIYKKKKKSL